MCVKKMEQEREKGEQCSAGSSPPPTPFHHPILFSSPISIVLGANWELAGGKWSGRAANGTERGREGVRMNGGEREERELWGRRAVSYMQIVFIVYDDFPLSLLFLFIARR